MNIVLIIYIHLWGIHSSHTLRLYLFTYLWALRCLQYHMICINILLYCLFPYCSTKRYTDIICSDGNFLISHYKLLQCYIKTATLHYISIYSILPHSGSYWENECRIMVVFNRKYQYLYHSNNAFTFQRFLWGSEFSFSTNVYNTLWA